MRLPMVCADAGNCHEGSLDVALKLIDEAKKASADLIKFQAGTAAGFARVPEDIERYKKYELGRVGYQCLIGHGKKVGIPVFFSVWSPEFADLYELEWKKIPSRQCANEWIEKYDSLKTFISIPNDMPKEEVKGLKIKQGIPLHCVPSYPAIDSDVKRFLWLKNYFHEKNLDIGYSDHTIGIEAAVELVSLGAVAIEKHFTLSHDFGPLRDHKHAATPDELSRLVERVKNNW